MGALGERVVRYMDARLYPSFDAGWDDALFREAIIDELDDGKSVLDLGAGAGIVPAMNFRGMARQVAGVDPDPRVRANPYLDVARVGFGDDIPFADESFDLVFANNVLEHLEDPARVCREVRRVLRPGGVFFAKTPNRWHYMPLIASLTPDWFHQWFGRLRGRATVDTFPTLYRANTPGALRRLAKESGLVVEHCLILEGRPEYLRFSAFSYLGGWFYERVVNSTPRLARFRIVLLAKLRRPA